MNLFMILKKGSLYSFMTLSAKVPELGVNFFVQNETWCFDKFLLVGSIENAKFSVCIYVCFTRKCKNCMNRCGIVGVDDGQIDLSLRESHLGGETSDIKDPEITSFSDLKVGMIVRDFVKSKTNVGYFVR